jgi:hypothetical protein
MDTFSQKNTQGSMGAPAGNQQQAPGQKTDYVDKAFDFASKKAGHDMNPQTDEKITDAGRGLYEKVTG